MSFWGTVAKFAPLAALAIPGVGPAVSVGLGAAGRFMGSPGGAAVTNLAGDLIGAGLQTRGANRAADITARANTDTLAWLKEQDARDRAEYEKERERAWRFEDEDRAHKYKREAEREGRLAPFRQGAERGYQTLSSLLFNPNQPLAVSPAISNAVQRRSLADLMRG